jgi:hypothetical protein
MLALELPREAENIALKGAQMREPEQAIARSRRCFEGHASYRNAVTQPAKVQCAGQATVGLVPAGRSLVSYSIVQTRAFKCYDGRAKHAPSEHRKVDLIARGSCPVIAPPGQARRSRRGTN